MKKSQAIGAMLWSIALPGFGQILNRQYMKGILLIGLEFLVNVMGNLNQVIVFSFIGETQLAIDQADYLWIMFYPCLYFFAIWDAYKDAGGGRSLFAYLPLVSSAYFVTIGLAISPVFRVFSFLPGPIWSMFIFLPIGLMVGFVTRFILLRNIRES